MKILLCHNHYQQRGGEDQVFADEGALLEAHDHEVIRYTLHNDTIKDMSKWDVARRTIWNSHSFEDLTDIIRRERPVLMHCTNTFPLISPAAYYAAKSEGVAVVQSLHNYRVLCPNALLFRNGGVCRDCLGRRIAWPAVLHGCYRGSRAASTVVTSMLAYHGRIKTWTDAVDQYIALSDFCREIFIEGGMPAHRIAVKPNCVNPDPGIGNGEGGYAVFVGRLSEEKGLDTLLNAWEAADNPVSLKIVGDGPLANMVRTAAVKDHRIEWLGQRTFEDTLAIIGSAACLIMPSKSHEPFGRTIIEAFAKATPVVVATRGAMPELVDDGRTGMHFEAGDPRQLAAAVKAILADRERLLRMRESARAEFERRYTADINYRQLMEIYKRVLQRQPNRAA